MEYAHRSLAVIEIIYKFQLYDYECRAFLKSKLI